MLTERRFNGLQVLMFSALSVCAVLIFTHHDRIRTHVATQVDKWQVSSATEQASSAGPPKLQVSQESVSRIKAFCDCENQNSSFFGVPKQHFGWNLLNEVLLIHQAKWMGVTGLLRGKKKIFFFKLCVGRYGIKVRRLWPNLACSQREDRENDGFFSKLISTTSGLWN